MKKQIHMPCHKCGSSDACTYFLDTNVGSCFSCNASYKLPSDVDTTPRQTQTRPQDYRKTMMHIKETFKSDAIPDRHIPGGITTSFGVKLGYDTDGKIEHHYYPYTRDNQVSAYKRRTVSDKTFSIIGDFKDAQLFGQTQASRVGGDRLVITEGELDAMAVATATFNKYKKIYPVVSIPSASGVSCAASNLSFINSF